MKYTKKWLADQENHCKTEIGSPKSKICLEFKQSRQLFEEIRFLHSASTLKTNIQIQKKKKRKNNLLENIKTKNNEKKRKEKEKEKKTKIQEPSATHISLFESPRAAFLQ